MENYHFELRYAEFRTIMHKRTQSTLSYFTGEKRNIKKIPANRNMVERSFQDNYLGKLYLFLLFVQVQVQSFYY